MILTFLFFVKAVLTTSQSFSDSTEKHLPRFLTAAEPSEIQMRPPFSVRLREAADFHVEVNEINSRQPPFEAEDVLQASLEPEELPQSGSEPAESTWFHQIFQEMVKHYGCDPRTRKCASDQKCIRACS